MLYLMPTTSSSCSGPPDGERKEVSTGMKRLLWLSGVCRFVTVHEHREGVNIKEGQRLYSMGPRGAARGNGVELTEWRCRLTVRKNLRS